MDSMFRENGYCTLSGRICNSEDADYTGDCRDCSIPIVFHEEAKEYLNRKKREKIERERIQFELERKEWERKERERKEQERERERKEWKRKEREIVKKEPRVTIYKKYTADDFRRLSDEQFINIGANVISNLPPDVKDAYWLVSKERESKR